MRPYGRANSIIILGENPYPEISGLNCFVGPLSYIFPKVMSHCTTIIFLEESITIGLAKPDDRVQAHHSLLRRRERRTFMSKVW